jgi:hypothetical protein
VLLVMIRLIAVGALSYDTFQLRVLDKILFTRKVLIIPGLIKVL